MSRIFYSFIFLATLFLISHFVFEPAYLYYEIPWLDIPMHILGGLGVGSLWYAIMTYRKVHVSYVSFILFFIVITIAWELYEYARGVIEYDKPSDYVDTITDVVNGFIGLMVAYFLVKK